MRAAPIPAALILAPALLLGACHFDRSGGGGGHATKDFAVGGFDRIALGGSYDAVVVVGGAPSVRAEGNRAAIDRLDVRVENGELKIEPRPNEGWSWGFGRHGGRTILHVTVPSLAGASIIGSGDMRIDKVSGRAFDGRIGGSGDMQIGALQTGEASFTVSGSGDLAAAGRTGRLSVHVAGSGGVSAPGLEAATADISVAGSGDVAARVTQSADVNVMGSGDVSLTGHPKCRIGKMGSGDVHCD